MSKQISKPPLESLSDIPIPSNQLALRGWSVGKRPMTDRAYAWTMRLMDEMRIYTARAALKTGYQATLSDTQKVALFVLGKLPEIPPMIDNPDNPLGVLPDMTAPTETMFCGRWDCSRPVLPTTRNAPSAGENGEVERAGCFPVFMPVPDKFGIHEKLVNVDNNPLPLCPECIEETNEAVEQWNKAHSTSYRLYLYDYETAVAVGKLTSPPGIQKNPAILLGIEDYSEKVVSANPLLEGNSNGSDIDDDGHLLARIHFPPRFSDQAPLRAERRARRLQEDLDYARRYA